MTEKCLRAKHVAFRNERDGIGREAGEKEGELKELTKHACVFRNRVAVEKGSWGKTGRGEKA